MKIKYILSLILLLQISLVVAQSNSIGTFKQGDCISLKQTCANCTYVNITSLIYPNSSQAIGQVQMTKSGTEYNYTFCDTNSLGDYIVNGKGDIDGIDEIWSFNFNITPSGNNGTNNIIFVIFIILIIYAVAFIGFFFKNEIVALMGGMFMVGLSIYLINNGIIIYRDWITNYFAYVTLGIGAFFSIISGMSLYQDL